jgi:hypothetical protein
MTLYAVPVALRVTVARCTTPNRLSLFCALQALSFRHLGETHQAMTIEFGKPAPTATPHIRHVPVLEESRVPWAPYSKVTLVHGRNCGRPPLAPEPSLPLRIEVRTDPPTGRQRAVASFATGQLTADGGSHAGALRALADVLDQREAARLAHRPGTCSCGGPTVVK